MIIDPDSQWFVLVDGETAVGKYDGGPVSDDGIPHDLPETVGVVELDSQTVLDDYEIDEWWDR